MNVLLVSIIIVPEKKRKGEGEVWGRWIGDGLLVLRWTRLD